MSTKQNYRNQITIAHQGADAFVQQYYNLFDTQRIQVGGFYRENSAIAWNGNTFQGLSSFQQFLQQLPVTNHDILAVDCQPLLGTTLISLIFEIYSLYFSVDSIRDLT
ncbi:hypothetical protein BKA69DRAFT_1054224, partial [Paraphysoderma sedebokerense]